MRGFKHVPAKFAESFEGGGSVKIGTYSYYRSLEDHRPDPYEGITKLAPGPIVFGPNPERASDAQRSALRRVGIDVGDAVISNSSANVQVIFEAPEAYLFCCSAYPDWKLADEGQSVFEITALRAFAKVLSACLPAIVGAPRVRRVNYKARQVDTLYEAPVYPDPFVKSDKCAHERETRIVWEIKQEHRANPEPFLIVSCPEAAEFIRRLR